jgi:hypothetical protein
MEHKNVFEIQIKRKFMRHLNMLKITYLVLGLTFLGLACSSSTGSNKSEAVIQGTFQGDVAPQSSVFQKSDGPAETQNFSGVTVFAAQVTSNGSVQAISGTETTTNASGNYSIAVDMAAAHRVVIVAQRGSQKWMGHLSSKVENGKNYTLKPINVESTAEAEVFARLVATGKADDVSKSDIETAVSAEAAAHLYGNTSAATTMASSLASAAEARAEFYTRKIQQNASQRLNQAMNTKAEAQFNLETSLHAATNASQREAAFEAFVDATVNAYVESGLTLAEASTMIDMWGHAVVNGSASASSEVRNRVRARIALYKAFAVDKAIRAEAQASGLSQSTVQAIASAGTSLKATVKASAGVQSEIRSAFESWHNEVKAAIENDSSAEATVIISLNAQINMSTGACTVFKTAISGAVSASILNTAYATFTSSVRSATETNLSGASSAKITAVSNTVLLMNLGQ